MGLSLFTQVSSHIGIDIGSKNIKIVHLKPFKKENKERYKLVSWALLPLPDNIVSQDTLPETRNPVIIQSLKDFLSKNKSFPKKVAVSVSGPSIIVRYIKLPLMTRTELEKSITVEAEPYIPFPINEVNIVFDIIGEEIEEGVKKNEIVLIAVRKETIYTYIDLLEKCGLIPGFIDVDIFALERTLKYCYEIKEDVVGIVNIGVNMTNVGIIENGVTRVTRDLPFGMNHIYRTLENIYQTKDKNFIEEYLKTDGMIISEEDKERYLQEEKKDQLLLSKNLVSVLKDLVSELKKIIDFFYFQKGEQKVLSKIYLSGGGSLIKNFDLFISQDLKIPVEIFSPFNNILNADSIPVEIRPLFGVAVGLALKK